MRQTLCINLLVVLCVLVCYTRAQERVAYDMTHRKRGVCLIINNHQFHPSTGMSRRDGTFKDEEVFRRIFRDVGFEVRTHIDVKRAKFLQVLNQLSNEFHGDSDALVIVILTHGEDGILWMTDAEVRTDSIFAYFKGFKAAGLIGKPKLFFFQACRGFDYDSGVRHIGSKRNADPRLPNEADFMVAYSVVPGYFSWRNKARGSWFAQAVGPVFTAYADSMDLLTMMTRASYVVGRNHASNTDDPNTDKMKQQIQIKTSLTKEVFFTSKRFHTVLLTGPECQSKSGLG